MKRLCFILTVALLLPIGLPGLLSIPALAAPSCEFLITTPPTIRLDPSTGQADATINIRFLGGDPGSNTYTLAWGAVTTPTSPYNLEQVVTFTTSAGTVEYGIPATFNAKGSYTARIYPGAVGTGTPPAGELCERNILVVGGQTDPRTTFMCNNEDDPEACKQCLSNDNSWTVVGCIPTGVGGFVQTILNLAVGMAGGIAFLTFLKGAFIMMTSGGSPQKVNEGKRTFSRGVAGIIAVIFATVILRILGADILNLPGFG